MNRISYQRYGYELRNRNNLFYVNQSSEINWYSYHNDARHDQRGAYPRKTTNTGIYSYFQLQAETNKIY